MFRKWNSTEVAGMACIGVITLVFFLILFECVWYACSPNKLIGTGEVIDRVYTPGHVSVMTTTGSDGKPQVGTATESETWKVIVRVNGKTVVADCTPEMWGSLQRGEYVHVRLRRSLLGLVKQYTVDNVGI